MPETSTSVSPSPTQHPTIIIGPSIIVDYGPNPFLDILGIVAVIVAIIIPAGILVYFKKRKRKKSLVKKV